MKKFKRELLIGVTGGFATGAIFLIGEGLSEIAKQKRGCTLTCCSWIKILIPIVLFLALIFRIMNLKEK